MSAETILQSMLANTDEKFDKSDGSFLYDVQKSVAIEIAKLETKSASFVDKIDVEKLVDEELKRFVYQRTGITRRAATFATGPVELVVAATAVVNTGDLVAAEDVFYEIIGAGNLTPGTHLVQVKCMQSGSIGNVPAGAINTFPVTLSNIGAVRNPLAFANGYDAETDETLRQRYYAKLRNPGKAGNPDHFKEWAQEVSGVGKVKVTPRWNGPLTVRIAILDSNDDFAQPELLEQVLTHILAQLSIGPTITVITAQRLKVDIQAKFVLAEGYAWSNVAQKISESLNRYFNEIAFADDVEYISYAQIGRNLLSVEGVADYSDLLINGGTNNLSVNEIEKAVAGSVVNNAAT